MYILKELKKPGYEVEIDQNLQKQQQHLTAKLTNFPQPLQETMRVSIEEVLNEFERSKLANSGKDLGGIVTHESVPNDLLFFASNADWKLCPKPKKLTITQGTSFLLETSEFYLSTSSYRQTFDIILCSDNRFLLKVHEGYKIILNLNADNPEREKQMITLNKITNEQGVDLWVATPTNALEQKFLLKVDYSVLERCMNLTKMMYALPSTVTEQDVILRLPIQNEINWTPTLNAFCSSLSYKPELLDATGICYPLQSVMHIVKKSEVAQAMREQTDEEFEETLKHMNILESEERIPDEDTDEIELTDFETDYHLNTDDISQIRLDDITGNDFVNEPDYLIEDISDSYNSDDEDVSDIDSSL